MRENILANYGMELFQETEIIRSIIEFAEKFIAPVRR